jgi:hypothetical protein
MKFDYKTAADLLLNRKVDSDILGKSEANARYMNEDRNDLYRTLEEF